MRRGQVDTAEARADRQRLVPRAAPQGGVAALAGAFPEARPVPGVTDNGDTGTRAVPVTTLRRD